MLNPQKLKHRSGPQSNISIFTWSGLCSCPHVKISKFPTERDVTQLDRTQFVATTDIIIIIVYK